MASIRKNKKEASTTSLPESDEAAEAEELEHGKPDDLKDLTADEIVRFKDDAFSAVQEDVKDYWMNSLFLGKEQWVKWVATDKAFRPWRRRGGRYQATVDKLGDLVTTYLGKIVRQDMYFEVSPSTADDYAIEGALVAEAVVAHKHDHGKWEDKREELLTAAIKGGTAFLVTEWDASANSYGSLSTGDTKETVLNITQAAVEPNAVDARTARRWVKAQVLPTKEVQSIFKLKNEPKADFNTGGPYAGALGGPNNTGKGAMVITYYERPNFLRPRGAVAVVVNDQLAWGPKPWPFPFKDHLNLEVVRETVIDGQWNGATRLTKARPVQVQYNFVHSNISDHIKSVGTAKLAAPYGSSEVFDQWDNDPSNPVRYPDGATPPGYIVPPNMPAYILQQLDRLENNMQDIMGIHGVSQGEAPGGVESGFGVQQLIEQDGSPATMLAKRTARAFQTIASDILEMYSANVKDTRKATVYRPDAQIGETIKWNGKTLAGQTNARIPEDAIIPHSRAAMMQFAQEIAKMGLLPPGQEGLTLMMELAEVPNRQSSMWYFNPQEARARYDVARIMQGEAVLPKTFNDQSVVIKVANRARLSPRYDTLPKQWKKNLDNYVLANQRFAEEQAGEQVSRAAMSPALVQAPTADQMAPLPPELTGIAPQPQPALPADQAAVADPNAAQMPPIPQGEIQQ